MQCVFNARDIKQIIMPRNIVFCTILMVETLFSGSFFVLVYIFSCTLKYVYARFFLFFKERVYMFSSTLKNSFTVFPDTKTAPKQAPRLLLLSIKDLLTPRRDGPRSRSSGGRRYCPLLRNRRARPSRSPSCTRSGRKTSSPRRSRQG